MHLLKQIIANSFVCYTDGIITGGSSLKHVIDNLDSVEDGPLDSNKRMYICITVWHIVPTLYIQM